MIFNLKKISELFRILRIFITTIKIMINEGPEGTGVDLLQLIQDAKKSVGAIHDIKIDFNCILHESLKRRGYKEDRSNKLILITMETTNTNITIKASVYPNSVQLDIGCSASPFGYDKEGALKLAKLLGFIRIYLCGISGHEAKLPPIGTWLIMHYHYNKDSKLTYDAERFHMTCEGALGEFTRIYDKEINGYRIIRIEEINTPRRAVKDELKMMLKEVSI